jgi:hypothetical protein
MHPERHLKLRGVVSDSSLLDDNTASNRNRPSRSRQFVEELRREFLYTEKRARDIIFNEAEAALKDAASPLTVSRLTREAAARGRVKAAAAAFEFANWETAAKASVNAMLAAQALLDREGAPIPVSIAAQATEVAALVPGFRDVTEAYLLETVIRRTGDVTARDHTALAHALFRQFDPSVPMEDMEDRVVFLLAMLADRVAVSEGCVYRVINSAGV